MGQSLTPSQSGHFTQLPSPLIIQVLDRRLLARLCLVLLDLEEETASPGRDGHGAVTAVPNAMPSPFFFDADSLYVRLEVVPPHIMAFVKELLAVPGPDERWGRVWEGRGRWLHSSTIKGPP